ncbi:protein sax-3-like [Macrobrachium nipponense]|uniref:protein sax-3-like n=1 Tax=Macrobrachium nipponense TaxID=159736 RepID=UPI0030C85D5B
MDILLFFCIFGVAASSEDLAPEIREQPSNVIARRNDPATLNCAASGAARITWFRDGQQVVTSSQGTRSHRVLLPSGSLFFLRVTSSRRESDAGTYWCVASNSYGSTRSQNATLTIATLSDEFEAYPEPVVKARIGDSVTLPCRAPKGVPEPHLVWLRDGREMTNTSRVSVAVDGDLVITDVTLEDSGMYVCRAQNVAGSRDTAPTELIIMIPPWFEKKPANVTTASGVLVELTCRAQGSPMPTVTWRRLDGIMPLGRATIEDQRLVLEQVTAIDSGVYVCEVQNEAGVATAKATLTVVDAPELMQRPQDIQVMTGKSTEITCVVEGDPAPLILWRLPTQDRTALLTPKQSSGHVSVSEDGQVLHLDAATTQDSGIYYCWGVSSGGGVSAQVEIMVVEAYPPPVIGVGPKDLNLAPGSVASFPCEAVSEAATPTITWWYRPAAHLPARQLAQGFENARISLSSNGALVIRDVRVDDGGIYTCKVSAETGHIEQEAILRISKDAVPAPVTTIPAPPSKPHILFTNETAVILKWLPNSQIIGGARHQYIVEYWRQGWDEWRVADTIMMDESCIVKNLTPGNIYTFLVRAVTKGGISFPSPWSDPVTIRPPRDPSLTMDQVIHARRRLSRPTVTLADATATGATSVLLKWKFLTTAHETVEGVLVYTVSGDGIVKVATVLGSSSSAHHLHNLEPNTEYSFFIVPFWRSVEGTPSNSFTLTTPEDKPVEPPKDVHATLREDGSILITWSSLIGRDARGKVTGYQVTLTHNGTETTETVSSPWLEAHGLAPGRIYSVKVAAETGAGLGPFSAPVLIDFGSGLAQGHQDLDEPSNETSVIYAPAQPDWLVYLLIPLVIMLFVCTILYIRRLHHKSAPSNPPQTPAHYQDPSIYPTHHSINMYSEQKLWRPSESEKEYGLSSVRLLPGDQQINEYAEPRSQHANETAEPYATTALLAPGSPRLVHQGSPWHQRSENSGMKVNWAAFLPPPPACPPPRELDLGDPAGQASPRSNRRGGYAGTAQLENAAGSEQYKRPCDATADHTYDTYSQVTSNNCTKDRFITFNTVQNRDISRDSADDQQAQEEETTDIPYNNTH